MASKLLSIVVPVYKVEDYLSQCIDSVVHQDFEDYELILVDDGSPDRCPQVCDEYAAKIDHIKVIHKPNGGLSEARNAGLNACEGQYVAFLDGDDYLTDGCLDEVSRTLIEERFPDLLTCAFLSVDVSGDSRLRRIQLKNGNKITGDYRTIVHRVLEGGDEIPWAAPRNIYRTDLIERHGLRFETDLVGAEDCAYFMEYIRHVKTYVAIDYPLFCYRTFREGSITNRLGFEAIMGQLRVFSRYYYEYSVEEPESIVVGYFARRFANAVSTLHFLTDGHDIAMVEEMVRDNRAILSRARGARYTIARAMWWALGYHTGSSIMARIRAK